MSDVVRSVRVVFDSSGVVRSLSSQDTAAKSSAATMKALGEENARVVASYDKVRATLDPAAASQLKYSTSVRTLDDALRRGITTQAEHTAIIDAAKAKYLSTGGEVTKFSQLIDQMGKFTHTAGGQISEMSGKLDEIHGKISEVSGVLEGLGAGGAIALGALLGVVISLAAGFEAFKILKEIIADGIKTQEVYDGLEASLRANGAAAGYSSAELIRLAEAKVNVTGRTKDEIVAGEKVLTQYQRLGREVYPLALQAALDYAQQTGKAIPDAAKYIGEAYDGNVRALTRLKDAGVTLSPIQRKTLQEMVDNGKIIEYQSQLTKILSGHLEGIAAIYAGTLGGSLSVAKSKFSLLGESIASEVIPSLQAVLSSSVKVSGGWDNLADAAKSAGHWIGSSIRDAVDTVAISYYEWESLTTELAIKVNSGLKLIAIAAIETVSAIASGLSRLPEALGGGDKWGPVLESIAGFENNVKFSFDRTDSRLRKESAEWDSASQHMLADMVLQNQALEGNDKVLDKHGRAEDGVAAKIKNHADALISLRQIVDAYTDKLIDLITKQQQQLERESALAQAAKISANVYDLEKQAQDRRAAIEAKLTELHTAERTELEKLTAARDKASAAHDSGAAAQAQRDIDAARSGYAALEKTVSRLAGMTFDAALAGRQNLAVLADTQKATDALAKAEAEYADARDLSTVAISNYDAQLEIDARIRALKPNSSTEILGIVFEINRRRADIAAINDQTTAISALRAGLTESEIVQAKLIDDLSRTQVIRDYGSEVESILSKYHLLDTATEKLRIHLQALSDARVKDGSISVEAAEEQYAWLAKINELDNVILAGQELLRAKTIQTIGVYESGFSAISTILQGSTSKVGAFTSSLATVAQSIEKLGQSGSVFSAEWTKSLVSAIASTESLLKSLNIGGSNKTGGTSGFGGKLEGNYASEGSAIGAIVGGIIAAIVSYGAATGAGVAIGGAVGGIIGSLISKAGDSASAHLSADGSIIVGEVSGKLSGTISDALTSIWQGVNNELASLGLNVGGLPGIDIKIRDNIIRVFVGNVERTFSSVADAVSFAIAQAVKDATTTGGGLLPTEVKEALSHTKATNLSDLQNDIAIAEKIANYGVPQVSQDLTKAVSSFLVELQNDARLGIDTTKSIANFARVVQQERDQILGIDRTKSPADQLRANVEAFNQRATLIKAQEQIDVEQNKLKAVELQQQITQLKAEGQLAIDHSLINKSRITSDIAVDQASVSSLGLLMSELDAVNQAITAEQAIIDGIILITDKELADALKRLQHVGKGAGAGADSLQSIRDSLEQARIALLGQEGQALANINAKYDDELKKAGKHADLIAQVTKARQAEIDVLSKQASAQYLTPYLGGQFSGTRTDYAKQLRDAAAAEADLTANAGKLKLSITDISSAFREQGRELGLQVLSDLGDSTASITLQYEKTGQAIDFLESHMADLSLTADQVASALSQLSSRTELSIFGGIQQYITDEKTLAQFKQLQYQIDIADAKTKLALAYEANALTIEAYNEIGAVLYGLPDKIPASVAAASTAASTQISAANTQLQAAQTANDAADKLTQWQHSLLTSADTSPLAPRAQVTRSKTDLDTIISKALSGDSSARDKFTSYADDYLKLFASTYGKTGAYAAEALRLNQVADKLKTVLSGNPAQNVALFPGYAASGAGALPYDLTGSGGGTTPGPGKVPAPPPRDDNARKPTPADPKVIDRLGTIGDRLGPDSDLLKSIKAAGVDAAVHHAKVIPIYRTQTAHLENIATSIGKVQSYLERVMEQLRTRKTGTDD